MIGYLSGTAITPDVVLAGHVGYQVQTPGGLAVDTEVRLWIHTAVRENDISLYGFAAAAHRDLFVALMKVSGVGPKVALNMLALGAGPLAAAILAGDAKALAKVPGIGVQKAQSILTAVRLPEVFLRDLAGDDSPADPLADLADVLVTMGHDRAHAREALGAVALATPQAAPPLLLRAALRVLAKA